MSEIWLPAQDNNSETKVHVAFSEVQWSGARLNFLEKNTKKLYQRVTALGKLNEKGSDDPLPAENLPEMRAREMHIELKLANPQAFNRDLTAEYLPTLYQKLQREQQSMQRSGKEAGKVFKQFNEDRLEYGVREHVLREILSTKYKACPVVESSEGVQTFNMAGAFDEAEAFDEVEVFSDYLADAKTRKLFVITVPDQLFHLHHRRAQPLLAAAYLQLVQIDISQQKHTGSAQLVQRVIMPAQFGKKENTANKLKSAMDDHFGGVFHRTLRTIERVLFRRHIVIFQQSLVQVLNNPTTAEHLLDLHHLTILTPRQATK